MNNLTKNYIERKEELDSFFNWADQIKKEEIERWKIMYGCEPKDVKLFLLKSNLSVLDVIEKEIKKSLETYYWDMNLDEDRIICVMKNRTELNKKVLQFVREAREEIKNN